MRLLTLLPVSVFALTAACTSPMGSAPANDTMASDGLTANETAANAAANAAMSMSDQDFADTMGASDMFEIESAKLARTKAASADVKSFAAMLIIDHNKSTTELKAAAAAAKPAIIPVPKMTAEQEANLAALRTAAAGAAFDAAYLSQQVAAHERALAILKTYAASGGNADFKAFATQTQVPVAMHLDKARAMQR
jgi:putative membrane protein